MNLATFFDAPRPTATSTAPTAWRRGFLTVAALGTAWNLFGIVQLVSTLTATPESLMGGGLNAAQAAAYLALPARMDFAFAVGVIGGLLGSLALGLRRRLALPVLAVSMLAYLALFVGDAQHGLFEAIPQQLAILATVLAIAGVLLASAWAARRSGWLR